MTLTQIFYRADNTMCPLFSDRTLLVCSGIQSIFWWLVWCIAVFANIYTNIGIITQGVHP